MYPNHLCLVTHWSHVSPLIIYHTPFALISDFPSFKSLPCPFPPSPSDFPLPSLRHLAVVLTSPGAPPQKTSTISIFPNAPLNNMSNSAVSSDSAMSSSPSSPQQLPSPSRLPSYRSSYCGRYHPYGRRVSKGGHRGRSVDLMKTIDMRFDNRASLSLSVVDEEDEYELERPRSGVEGEGEADIESTTAFSPSDEDHQRPRRFGGKRTAGMLVRRRSFTDIVVVRVLFLLPPLLPIFFAHTRCSGIRDTKILTSTLMHS
ncbi:hypothetical protein BDY19DRAFT_912353 [Irpex rosettiformis]|uniref:Uncharacterized protein n=1 Tax=Irpex rosettiformis TaxID=378272 RepID=A0ACB8UJJ1_9APHY|nr:hypothetical protein BDY19DRAFT_912353 [Irpex rosettiformis]